MVFAERKDNFYQGYCPAGTIRMAMEEPKNYENCKGGANAVCCEPQFLTEANNQDEVMDGFVLALENVLPNPQNCDWGKTADGKNTKRGLVDFASDCLVVIQGLLEMLASPDVGLLQKY
jgi:hypothetical protein